jgi:hypothetical protein
MVGRLPIDLPHEAIPARLVPTVTGMILRVEPGEILLRGLWMNVHQPASATTDDGVSLLDRDGLRRITAAKEARGEARLRHLNEPASPGATN